MSRTDYDNPSFNVIQMNYDYDLYNPKVEEANQQIFNLQIKPTAFKPQEVQISQLNNEVDFDFEYDFS